MPVPEECTPPTYKPPNNPQATLEGLPAELRLSIYDHLSDTIMVHVHKHADSDVKIPHFTWTPCRAPNPEHPLLCANPKWSGKCEEEDRGTHNPNSPRSPRGFWALAEASTSLHREIQRLWLRRAVVSIHPQHLRAWLDHLSRTPHQLAQLRRVTLAGPDLLDNSATEALQLLHERVPHLTGVGFQCQDVTARWVRWRPGYKRLFQSMQLWKKWNIFKAMEVFDASIVVAMEAMVWQKVPRYKFDLDKVEVLIAVRMWRGVGEGREESGGEESEQEESEQDGVKVEVDSRKVVAHERNAKWRYWWRGGDMKAFGLKAYSGVLIWYEEEWVDP